MATKVVDLMTAPARAVQPDNSLFTATEMMWHADCGGLPVVDEAGRPSGFITDRDIAMCAAIQGRTLHEMPVSAAMTFGAQSVAAHASPRAAHALLQQRRVRRLPVVDTDGKLVGLLSLADLVRDAAAHPRARTRQSDLRASVARLAEPWENESARGAAAGRIGNGAAPGSGGNLPAQAPATQAAVGKTRAASARRAETTPASAAMRLVKKAPSKARKATPGKSGRARGGSASSHA